MSRYGWVPVAGVLVLLPGCAKQRQTISISLLDELPRARISAKRDILVKEDRLTVDGDTRRCLFMHPVSSAEFDLVMPARARFVFAAGVPQDVWDKGGDGVEFTADLVDGTGTRHALFSRYVNPKAVRADRCWHDADIDLSLYEGQKVTMVLSTAAGPANNPGWDMAGWADPVIRGITW